MSLETLKNKASFEKVYKLGKRLPSGSSLFFYLKNESLDFRIGLVTRRAVGNAPFRNRTKRIMREVLNFFHIPGYDVVISVRSSAVFEMINFRDDYLKLWRKLNKC